MDRATLFLSLGIGLCGAATGCESDPEDVFDYCPSGACGSASDNSIYSPLELFSHELVHGHLIQLGLPRPWLAEGMAVMLEDSRWSVPDPPMTPSKMLAQSDAWGLSYDSAGSFVRYLRDRFGMPAVIELYAALDRVDAEATPDVFLAVLGEDWKSVEHAYVATFTPVPVGSLNCDFPVLAPEEGTWTLPVASPCEDAATVGPFLGLDASFIPHNEHSVIVEIPEAGIYTLTMTSSADVAVDIDVCDVPLIGFARYATQVELSIEFVPGRKRLMITTYGADEAVGEVVLRREPSAVNPARQARPLTSRTSVPRVTSANMTMGRTC